MEKRKHFTPEQKAEVIKGERTLNEIAAEYGIHPNLLARLLKQIGQLSYEVAWLKKNSSKSREDRMKMIDRNEKKLA